MIVDNQILPEYLRCRLGHHKTSWHSTFSQIRPLKSTNTDLAEMLSLWMIHLNIKLCQTHALYAFSDCDVVSAPNSDSE